MVPALALLLAAAPTLHVSLVKSTATEASAAVQKELKAQLAPLEGCYDLALKDNPSLTGSVTVTFTAERDEGVSTISAGPDSVKDDTLVSCVLARLRFGEWPNPKKTLKVTAVFHFAKR